MYTAAVSNAIYTVMLIPLYYGQDNANGMCGLQTEKHMDHLELTICPPLLLHKSTAGREFQKGVGGWRWLLMVFVSGVEQW